MSTSYEAIRYIKFIKSSVTPYNALLTAQPVGVSHN